MAIRAAASNNAIKSLKIVNGSVVDIGLPRVSVQPSGESDAYAICVKSVLTSGVESLSGSRLHSSACLADFIGN